MRALSIFRPVPYLCRESTTPRPATHRGVPRRALSDPPQRHLEALRRAGIVERMQEGMWRVPADLVARGQTYDRHRTGGLEVELHSHLPIDKQVSALGRPSSIISSLRATHRSRARDSAHW